MLQDLLAHEAHELDPAPDADDVAKRLLPPPIPNEEKSFWISALPQSGQRMSFSPPIRTSASKWRQHFLQTNSYIGIGLYFTRVTQDCPQGHFTPDLPIENIIETKSLLV